MKHSLFLAAAGLLLTTGATAQNPLGTFLNTGTTWATRGLAGAANNNPVIVFTRHDMEHYAGWTDGAVPNMRDISGLDFVIQDNDLSTVQNFNMMVFLGDPAMPDFPDITTPVSTSGNLILPTGVGGGAYRANQNFATPISVPAANDIYVALQFNSAWTISGGMVTDGLSVWECNAASPTTPQTGQAWDEPGGSYAGSGPAETFSGFYVASPATGPSYPVETQMKIQPLIPISGGVATALTNQLHHAESTTGAVAGFTVQDPGAGTTAMFSSLYPDAATPAANTGRMDDIGMMFRNDTLAAGSPVFFMIDIGPFGPEIPAANFVPGSTGVSCLSFATMQNLGFVSLGVSGTTQRAFKITTFPAAVRPILQGIDWMQQAIALDIGTNTIHATACTRQKT